MKKLLVLVAVMALCASTAMAAGIRNTKHDLSSSSSASWKGTSNEICVYCHTPHGASAAAGAPLWNRNTVSSTGAVYSTSTLNAVATIASVNLTDAVLCLSCHDGSSLTGTLNNPPNSGGGNPATNLTGQGNLATDLSNDHPIGFNYAAINALDSEIQPTAVVTAAGLKVTYGVSSNQMWCSSCHDVHSNTNSPFLAKSNVASALCLVCHIK